MRTSVSSLKLYSIYVWLCCMSLATYFPRWKYCIRTADTPSDGLHFLYAHLPPSNGVSPVIDQAQLVVSLIGLLSFALISSIVVWVALHLWSRWHPLVEGPQSPLNKPKRGGLTVALSMMLLLLMALTGVVLVFRQCSNQRFIYAQADSIFLSIKLDMYKTFIGHLPSADEGLDALIHKPASVANGRWYRLLERLPLDPWGHAYQYKRSSDYRRGYDVFSSGADGIESADDIHLP